MRTSFPMIVLKFGGTSVGSSESIERVISLIEGQQDRSPVVIVSALSKVTDLLIATATKAAQGSVSVREVRKRHEEVCAGLGIDAALLDDDFEQLGQVLKAIAVVKKITPELYALTVSFGERMSSKIVAAAAQKAGLPAQAFNSYDLGLRTNSDYREADVLLTSFPAMKEAITILPAGTIPIITGFIAKDEEKKITTLGRGGSDYSAALFGAAIDAQEIQIWTDVDGVMTSDPRMVRSAAVIDTLTFKEASELAYFGAKVLHPKTIVPAIEKNIPVRILNTFNPAASGTTVVQDCEQKQVVSAIAHKNPLTTITISQPSMLFAHGFVAEVFSLFAKHKVSVDMISTSEITVSVTVDSKFEIDQLVRDLRELGEVNVRSSKSSISVVGRGMMHTPGIAGVIFGTLGSRDINVEMISLGASDVNIGLVVDSADCAQAVNALHAAFFENPVRNVLNTAKKSSGDNDGR